MKPRLSLHGASWGLHESESRAAGTLRVHGAPGAEAGKRKKTRCPEWLLISVVLLKEQRDQTRTNPQSTFLALISMDSGSACGLVPCSGSAVPLSPEDHGDDERATPGPRGLLGSA